MNCRVTILYSCFLLLTVFYANAQNSEAVSIQFIKKQNVTVPNQIINIPFFIVNRSTTPQPYNAGFKTPEGWNVVTRVVPGVLKPSEKKFSVISLQVPSGFPIGEKEVVLQIFNAENNKILAEGKVTVTVDEIENISLETIEAPEYVNAGDDYKASYLLQNLGNTAKKVFIQTSNCDVIGPAEIKLNPGETKRVDIIKKTMPDISDLRKEYFSVRALIGGEVKKSTFHYILIFPSQNAKKDFYFRYPVKASAIYLATNQNDRYQSIYQFEISGNGALDPNGKHQLEFLARGPNSANLSYLGIYDQYFATYSNKNLELSVGEKSYSFTPLTESSRFGMGVENRVILNNGLSFGVLYVKPRYYEDINNEMSVYTEFEKDRNNRFGLFYVLKRNSFSPEPTHLASLNTAFQPLKKTTVELELSRGTFNGFADNALRTSLSTQFSIFRASGNYYYTGKYYPGYYTNSTFYMGSASAQISPKTNIGFYARQDFTNAQLDTFFIEAPYSKSFQTFLNYKIANRAYLRVYWREYERKDRLSADKFHYKNNSINSEIKHKLNNFEYTLLGEYGKTTNFLLDPGANTRTTYRGAANILYRFNSQSAIRVFGSWSNVNSFVSNDQRRLTAGMSVSTQITKKLKANFHLQNAYDIDDYYRNRNLMQFHLDYKINRKHLFQFRSYYTLFQQKTENPEFFLSATYQLKIGVPLKRVIKAGDIVGHISNDNNEPVKGLVIHVLNKTAITDEEGNFSIKTLQPGRHLLMIERKNLAIDDIASIPTPIQVEVFEDQETPVNFSITKGAKLNGQFVFDDNNKGNNIELARNIIVELKSDFEEYRITSNKKGEFSFPIVIPGKWTLKVYENSLPAGFVIDQNIYNYNFKSGQRVELNIVLKPKKRNIIFKSKGITLSNSANKQNAFVKLSNNQKPATNGEKLNSEFYSIQIGAFNNPLSPTSNYFKSKGFDFERQINNLYKYYRGKYNKLHEALTALETVQKDYKNAFVVRFENNEPVK